MLIGDELKNRRSIHLVGGGRIGEYVLVRISNSVCQVARGSDGG
jgi:hypothetical protein